MSESAGVAEITLEPTMTSPVPAVVVPAEELLVSPTSRTRRFVGREHGSGISYFFVDNEPGQGPGLHWHPYPETWVVIEGSARVTIGDQVILASAGDTATVPAGVWHGFKNAGPGRLRILCIHASDTIIQTWAE